MANIKRLCCFSANNNNNEYKQNNEFEERAMVLGILPVPGRPTIWIIVGQGPTVLQSC